MHQGTETGMDRTAQVAQKPPGPVGVPSTQRSNAAAAHAGGGRRRASCLAFVRPSNVRRARPVPLRMRRRSARGRARRAARGRGAPGDLEPSFAAVRSPPTGGEPAPKTSCMEAPAPWLSILGKQQLLEAASAEFDALVPAADRPNACRALALLLRVRLPGSMVVTPRLCAARPAGRYAAAGGGARHCASAAASRAWKWRRRACCAGGAGGGACSASRERGVHHP